MTKFADCRIREARQRVTALNRAMADLGRRVHALAEDHPARQEAQRELARLGVERDAAVTALERLLLLDELPAEVLPRA